MALATLGSAGSWTRKLLHGALDLVPPPRCPGCRTVVAVDRSFCADCWAGLEFITDPLCAGCGMPFEVSLGAEGRCGACLLAPRRFDAARSALVYGGAARAVLLGFKHDDRQHLAQLMAPQLARAAAGWLDGGAVLVPVPLHRWRLWRRGFNQAALLAQALGTRTRTAVAVDALIRVRATPSSQGMNPQQRAANVRAAFRVARPDSIRGRDVIVIDDVYTTGATVEACARVLRRAGAASVKVVTWARVVRGSPL